MTRVLVPVAILEGETVSAGLVDLLSEAEVTILGYHEIPEQTPPDQARAQFEDRATEALDDLTAEFEEAGGTAEHRLVFTHDSEKTIDRIATETDSEAYAITGTAGPMDRLLVSLTGDVAVSRITDFVESVVGDREIGVTLFATEIDDSRLETAAEQLTAAGIETETRLADGKPFDALIDVVAGHDAIIMGEKAPSLSSFLFGDEADRVAAASVGPVLVVRNPEPEDSSPDQAE